MFEKKKNPSNRQNHVQDDLQRGVKKLYPCEIPALLMLKISLKAFLKSQKIKQIVLSWIGENSILRIEP